mgnify:CR=1 FL=1
MAFIPKINGAAIAAPLPFDQTISALDKDSGRTASGKMIRYFIDDKVKLAFEWNFITITEGRQILSLVKGDSCLIEYDDSALGVVTKKFHVIERTSKMSTAEGVLEYVKFNAIEF